MDILIDSREKERKIRAADFYAGKGHSSTIKSLDVGDYVFSDQVVFEYKEIGDFMSSILNESLFNEASNQALEYPFHYVIIVGEMKSFVKNNWAYNKSRWNGDYPKYIMSNYSRYYGALRRLRTFTTPIEVSDEKQALHEMLLQSIKCLDGKSKFYSNVTRPVPSQDAVDVLLCSAKNISSKKANAIREHHTINTIYDLMDLTVNDFKEVEGIGEITSNTIYQFLHKGEDEL
jgi:ERCC4-type nuclease